MSQSFYPDLSMPRYSVSATASNILDDIITANTLSSDFGYNGLSSDMSRTSRRVSNVVNDGNYYFSSNSSERNFGAVSSSSQNQFQDTNAVSFSSQNQFQDQLRRGSAAAFDAAFFSQVETDILRAANPIDIQETEVINVNGQSGIWANKHEVVNWRGLIPINQYLINEDQNPEIVRKQTEQKLIYEQEIAIRYLRPPTPPPPGEILIKQEKNIVIPPAPPLVIRQQPPRPETPAPLIIREAPPKVPAPVGQKLVTISGKRLPPPPRKVVIERLAPLPSKPQSLVVERWLSYKDQRRRVIFTKSNEPDPIIQKPRNVIVQWEPPQLTIKKSFKDLGVIRANPADYVQRYGPSLKSANELPDFAREIKPPSGIILAADHVSSSSFELEGDVHALGFIDLDREGLNEYRSYLRQGGNFGSIASVESNSFVANSNQNNFISELFASIDRSTDGRLSLNEAERLLLTLNTRLGRRYTYEDARIFLTSLDSNRDGFIDLQEFQNAITIRFLQ